MAPTTSAIIPGHGGSFTVGGESGEVTPTAAPTQDHPDGNAPRNAEGRKLHLGQPIPAEPEQLPAEPEALPAARARESRRNREATE